MADPIDSRSGGNLPLAVAIVAAAFIVSWGGSGDQPRYQLTASDSAAYRMDTDSGELIACNRQRCARVEPPDRAKTFGPLTVQFDSKPENALPAPTAESNKTP